VSQDNQSTEGAHFTDSLRYREISNSTAPEDILIGLKKMSTSSDYWWSYWQRKLVLTQPILDENPADFGFSLRTADAGPGPAAMGAS
jgi:hypothetical protein